MIARVVLVMGLMIATAGDAARFLSFVESYPVSARVGAISPDG